MSNPTKLLPRTALAVCSWIDSSNKTHIRVYTQDLDDGIRESRYDGSWTGGTAKDVLFKAKPHTALAAHCFDNGKEIRLYYLGHDNMVCERVCSRDKWSAGDLDKFKAQASPVTSIAVVGTNPGAMMNVYYQNNDNIIQEIRYDKKWFQGTTLSKAMVGTGLAALTFNQNSKFQGIRVYFQLPNAALAEDGVDVGKGWKRENFTHIPAPAGTDLAVISWGKDPNFRLYLISQAGELREYAFSDSKWNQGWTLPASAVPASSVAATAWGAISDIRVYRQANDNQILEEVWHNGWSVGSIVPTGHVQD